jgi:hypothetical protein
MRSVRHPHLSPALRHLRNCTLVVMAAFAAALLTQAGVFLFVHLSDAHTRTLAVTPPGSTAVVRSDAAARSRQATPAPSNAEQPGPSGERQAAGTPSALPQGALVVRGRVINLGQSSAQELEAARAQTINVVQTPLGLRLQRAVGLAQTVGIVAAIALCVLMLEGVAVGAAARVPGIHHIVSSATWMLLMTGLTVPLGWLAPSILWPGVFAGYDAMLDSSALVRAGHGSAPSALMLYAQHLLVPLCCLAGLVAVALRFTAAVEEGVIVTHASQLDEKVEREIRAIGTGHAKMPRSVGALNAAIGAVPGDEPDEHDEDVPPISGPRVKRPMPRPI